VGETSLFVVVSAMYLKKRADPARRDKEAIIEHIEHKGPSPERRPTPRAGVTLLTSIFRGAQKEFGMHSLRRTRTPIGDEGMVPKSNHYRYQTYLRRLYVCWLVFGNNVHDETYVGDEDDDDDHREGQMVWAWCCVLFDALQPKKVKCVYVAAVTRKVGRRYFRVRFRSPALPFSTPTAFPRARQGTMLIVRSFLSTHTNAPSRAMIHLLRKLLRCWSELDWSSHGAGSTPRCTC
jgi:hypothetical protein